MDIIAIPKNLTEIDDFKRLGVTTLLFESDRFSRAAVLPLDDQNLIQSIITAKEAGMKVYVRLDRIVKETDLEDLEMFVRQLVTSDPDAIVFHDLTIGVLLASLGEGKRGIYQPGTFNTHRKSLSFLRDLGIFRATLSKEITFPKIVRIIKNNPDLELSLVGHGYIDIFYSHRPLITLFHQHKGIRYVKEADYRIGEKSRKGELYPVAEINAETLIYRPGKIHSFFHLDYLKKHIQAFFIERYLLSGKEYLEAIAAYSSGRYEAFLETYGDEYDASLYDKETALKKVPL